MTVFISKKDKLENILAKLEKLGKSSNERKQKSFTAFSGKLSVTF